MAKIVIEGTPYDLPDNLTFRENKLAKAVADLPVWQFGDAFVNDRAALALAYAAIAYKRANPLLSDDQIAALFVDRPLDKIVFDFTEEVDEAPTPAVDEDGELASTSSGSSTTETPEPSGGES